MNSVEEKLDVDKVIQAGMLNHNLTGNITFLEAILEKGDDDGEEEVPDDEQLNDTITRKEKR